LAVLTISATWLMFAAVSPDYCAWTASIGGCLPT